MIPALLLLSLFPAPERIQAIEDSVFHRAVAAQMQATLDQVATDMERIRMATAELQAECFERKKCRGEMRVKK